jgi:hypothetical protein
MGEAEARSAESAIDRDKWGRGEPGDVKKKCPKGCKREYRIHPAIGLARVGNSPDQFFIGPEKESDQTPTSFFTLNVASPTKMPAESTVNAGDNIYKDKKTTTTTKGQIRRQAARFRIFEYREMNDGSMKWVREITSDEAEIKWTVQLANKKGSFFNFNGPNMAFANRFASSGSIKREAPTIEPPETSITVPQGFDPKGTGAAMKTAKLSTGSKRFDDKDEEIAEIGQILHDEKGRLVVLGGFGKAGSKTAPGGAVAPIKNYANNVDWVDDVSDGWIAAEIKFPDEKKPIATADTNGDAWVLVGPPDFGPELTNVTSIYDTLVDIFVRTKTEPKNESDKVIFVMHGIDKRVKGNFKPYFDYDLRRLFEATVQTATVFKPANPQMKHPAVQRLAESTHKDDRKETPENEKAGLAPNAHLRYKIFNTLRPPWEARRRDPDEGVIRHPSEKKTFSGLPPLEEESRHVVPPPAKPAKKNPAQNDDELKRYQQYRWTMPLLWGDADPDYRLTRCTVTETQYKLVRSWWEGSFVEAGADDFDNIPRSSAITPGGLDRAALERGVGAPFWPGIEVSWLCRCPEIYVEPLRVKKDRTAKTFKLQVDKPGGGKFTAFEPVSFPAGGIPVKAGFFSQQMAQPWQADFLSCLRYQDPAKKFKVGWWPAQRPDDVIRGGVAPADRRALKEPTSVALNEVIFTETDLKKSGVDELKKHARNLTFTVDGRRPEQAPRTVTIKGKDEAGNDKDGDGNPYGETINLPRNAATVRGDKLYSAVTEVKYAPAELPKTTEATLAIGYEAAGTGDPADDDGLEAATPSETKGRDVTRFLPRGVAALARKARRITFTTGGAHPVDAPLTATVIGKDSSGADRTDTVALAHTATTVTGAIAFASISRVTYGKTAPPPTLQATVSIGFGAFMGNMEQWDAGITGWEDNTVNWWRLGFVVNGTEIERDPTLTTAASTP